MNLLKCYIKEIHNIKDISDTLYNWKNKTDEPFLEVNLTCICEGIKERKKYYFTTSEFEKIKKQGYFMS